MSTAPANRALNPLQELIRERCESHNETLSDIASRAGLSRQTLSALMNRPTSSGVPRADTLNKLAVGLDLSPHVVRTAASEAALSDVASDEPYDQRVVVLLDKARRMSPQQIDVLLATARALQVFDTPS